MNRYLDKQIFKNKKRRKEVKKRNENQRDFNCHFIYYCISYYLHLRDNIDAGDNYSHDLP